MNFFNAPDAQGDAGISLDDVSAQQSAGSCISCPAFRALLSPYGGCGSVMRMAPPPSRCMTVAVLPLSCASDVCCGEAAGRPRLLLALARRCWRVRVGGIAWCRSARQWRRCRTRATSTPPLMRTTSRWARVKARQGQVMDVGGKRSSGVALGSAWARACCRHQTRHPGPLLLCRAATHERREAASLERPAVLRHAAERPQPRNFQSVLACERAISLLRSSALSPITVTVMANKEQQERSRCSRASGAAGSRLKAPGRALSPILLFAATSPPQNRAKWPPRHSRSSS